MGKKVKIQAAAGQEDVVRREIVHIFQKPRNQPNYDYLGPFVVDPNAVGANQFTGKPMWTLSRGDRAKWLAAPPSLSVRVRPTVPTRYPKDFSELYGLLESVERDIGEIRGNETKANDARKSALAQITTYRDMLFGQGGGLVKQLESKEEARNQVLEVVDGLRRQLKALVDYRDRLAKDLKARQ